MWATARAMSAPGALVAVKAVPVVAIVPALAVDVRRSVISKPDSRSPVGAKGVQVAARAVREAAISVTSVPESGRAVPAVAVGVRPSAISKPI